MVLFSHSPLDDCVNSSESYRRATRKSLNTESIEISYIRHEGGLMCPGIRSALAALATMLM
eukprot:3474088-Amphidinium_carterae.1